MIRQRLNATREHAAASGMPGYVRKVSQRGFSLLEMLISMAILVLVISLAFDQIMQLQKKAAAESARVEMGQQAREFIDQTVRDLHVAGYPNASMFANTISPAVNDGRVAAGIVSVSPTQIAFEGDLNNDGQVFSVNISYVAADPNDSTCPCIRRHAIPKAPGVAPTLQPISANYTEIDHVMPPGTGSGQSGEDLFAFYQQDGTQISAAGGLDIGTAQPTIAAIRTIKINLSQLANNPDPGGNPMRTSLSSTVRLNQ